ncbi:MAG: malto-oligosyltrehalose trehalohydrolase, partial [Nitrospiraceae bacterium]
TALQEGFVCSGQRSSHRRRRHGNSARHRPSSQLIVYSQNHDQIGNRAFGDRLTTLVSFEALKVAAATVLLAPNTPLLFMGEEYGETAPFQYFIDHGDQSLVEAVRKGRREEFAAFGWADVPDPQAPATFERSRIHPGKADTPEQSALLDWYRTLIRLRKTVAALGTADASTYGHLVRAHASETVVSVHRWTADGQEVLLILGFNSTPVFVILREPVGQWHIRLNSSSRAFGGHDQPFCDGDIHDFG